jgi:hypothetical protein
VVLQPDEKPSNLLCLYSYLTSTRINKTIERNLLMADSYRTALRKSTQQQSQQPDQQVAEKPEKAGNDESGKAKNAKPQDIVRLYDIIIQVSLA